MPINLSSKTLAFFVTNESSFTDGFTIKEIEDRTKLANKTVYNHINQLIKVGFVRPCAKSQLAPNRKAFYFDRTSYSHYSPTGEVVDPDKAVSVSDATILLETVTSMAAQIDVLTVLVKNLSSNSTNEPYGGPDILEYGADFFKGLGQEIIKRKPDITAEILLEKMTDHDNIVGWDTRHAN